MGIERPKLSYVVSAYNRPERLSSLLWALKAQTDPDYEVVITDNAMGSPANTAHMNAVSAVQDRRFHYHQVGFLSDPGAEYRAAAHAVSAGLVTGKFLCFPSDDSYYVPTFGAVMLKAAADNRWDFVYCDVLYDPRWRGKYAVMTQQPKTNCIDKTGFIVSRHAFEAAGGFSDLPLVSIPGRTRPSCQADGALAERLVENGVRHGHVDQCLVVHN